MERKSIGTFIAALRRANGMTQKDLAERLSVSDKAVSRWERDESLPDLLLLPMIADIFHITVDELLRGERKAEAADNAEEVQDTAAETVRLKKQTRRALNVQLNRLRSSNCIAIYIGALGVLVAIVCNFGFSRGLIGFCVGVVCIAVSVLLTVLFCQSAWQAAEDEAYEETSVCWYRQQVVRWMKLMAFLLLGMLALCIPFGATIFDYSRYLDVFVEKGSWFRWSAVCLAVSETALSFACYFLNKGILKKYKLSPDEEAVQLHGWCIKTLCIVMVVTILFGMLIPDVGEMVMTRGEKFDNVEAFVAEMNRRWEAQRQSGIMDADSGAMMIATTHYDSQGNEISAQEASIHYVYDREGGVIAEYHQPYDVTGVRVQYTADDGIDITVNTAADIRMAEHERNLRINLLTMIFAIEPLLALLAYFILRPVKRKKN